MEAVNKYLLSDEEWDAAHASETVELVTGIETSDKLPVFYTPLNAVVMRPYRFVMETDPITGLKARRILLQDPLVRAGERLIATERHRYCIVLEGADSE